MCNGNCHSATARCPYCTVYDEPGPDIYWPEPPADPGPCDPCDPCIPWCF